MNKNDISTLIQFNYWANGRILQTCQNLTTEQFTQSLEPNPGWGSLRGILVHTLDTEYGWRTVLQAIEDIIMNEADFPNVASVEKRWQEEQAAWVQFVDSLSDDQLNQGYGVEPESGPKVWQTIMHVVTHSIQHRAEAAYILTGYGHSPGELDFAVFMKDRAAK